MEFLVNLANTRMPRLPIVACTYLTPIGQGSLKPERAGLPVLAKLLRNIGQGSPCPSSHMRLVASKVGLCAEYSHHHA